MEIKEWRHHHEKANFTNYGSNTIMHRFYRLADDFSIHSGVTFGMSESQVSEKEDQNGFSLNTEYIGLLLFGMSKGSLDMVDSYLSRELEEKVDIPCISGSVAGYDESQILYFFTDDKLYSAVYHIGQSNDTSRFANLSDALTKKYGNTVASNGEYIDYPSQGKTAKDMYKLFDSLGAFSCTIIDTNQWLVETDSGYVSILLLNTSISGHNEVFLSYSSMNKEEYNTFVSDKLETYNQKEQELNNDL